jgi:Uma2 family endonuclease
MATVMLARPKMKNVADLLAHLGGIPPERVRLSPTPGTATEKDILEILERENRACELIDGVVVEKPVGWMESFLAMRLGHFIQSYLDHHDLGVLTGEKGMLRLLPQQIRIPDVAFYSWVHFPNRELPAEAVPRLYPDLAVEVLSEGNTEEEMKRKLREYFKAGTKLVWLVDPKARTVRVHTSPRKVRLVTEQQTLDGGEVLPGFQLPMRKLFDRPGRRKLR